MRHAACPHRCCLPQWPRVETEFRGSTTTGARLFRVAAPFRAYGPAGAGTGAGTGTPGRKGLIARAGRPDGCGPVAAAPGPGEAGRVATDTAQAFDYSDLTAVYVNCTLKRSPEPSNTEGLIDKSRAVMEAAGARTSLIRAVDHDIATGVWPDMTDHGWESDQWPVLYSQIMGADILVLCGPIWLGDNSSVMKQVIERLYACSSILNRQGQYAYYGRVGGKVAPGNRSCVAK